MTPGAIFLDYSVRKLLQLTERIHVCLGRLDPEQIWERPNPSSNSLGNLVLHLCGNVRQWIMAGAGGAPDVRQRDAEFAAGEHPDLTGLLSATVEEACAVLRALPEARLLEVVTIQGYRVTVLEAVYQVVEHFSGHTFQIIWQTKALTDRPLGFYAHLDRAHGQQTP